MITETHGVKIRHVRVLRGPNLYAYMPVLHVVMDIDSYEDRASNTFPGFVDRLTAWLPGLHTHECSVGRPGGFIERLNRGTYLGHICEHIALELQSVMGFDVSFGKVRGTGERGVYNVLVAYKEEEPALAAFDTALRLTLAAMHDEPFDVEAEIEQLLTLADDYRLGPSTAAIVRAARARNIPVLRLTPTGSLVQLGHGIYQKRILASETSNTNSIAVEMCQEKPLTNRMLRAVGVPVPDGRKISSADAAWETAQEIGLPVVIKPGRGNQGKGVSVDLSTEADIREAYAIAAEFDSSVLVEKYIHGSDYRLLVINGRMVAAARRDSAHVVGDGIHTIRELVEIVNKDPRRRPGHSSALTKIRLDDTAQLVLSQQNLTPESILAVGQQVKLRINGNLSTGGTATDVTDEVHPRNVQLAELAAQILALDVAGIDIVCENISRPLGEQGGAVVEVNAGPGLRMHLYPTHGQPRDVGTPIVEMLYPDNAPSRIPIIAVTGTNGKTTVTRLISHIYETAHWVVGMTSTNGTYINKERIMAGDCSGPKSAQAVLLHPNVEVAVLETARGGIIREGLAFDFCTVGVVTNLSSDHLGLGNIHTLEDLARVKQVVVESVRKDGAAVLNADDDRVAEMAAATDARVVYFSSNADSHVITAHLAEGGSAVFVRDNRIILATGDTHTDLVELGRVSFTQNGRIGFQVQNALAAIAAAWAGGINPAMIVRALTTFSTDFTMTPGRFNIMEVNKVQIILDYGHNQAAVSALMQATEALGQRHTTLIMGLPGDRRDEDLAATIKATIPYVDHYILHDLTDRRDRQPYEVPQLLRNHLPGDVDCDLTENQHEAILKAWSQMQPGDRLIVIADLVDETIQLLRSLTSSLVEDASCTGPITVDAMAGRCPSRRRHGLSQVAY